MNTDFFVNLNANNRYFRNFKKDAKLIVAIMVAIIAWSVFYVVFFHHPKYKSEAKVWVKDLSTREFVTNLDMQGQLAPLISSGNPILTQIEILKSDQLARAIEEYKLDRGEKVPKKRKLNIDIKNRPNTDILNISLLENSPAQAQQTLEDVLKEYDNINVSINNQIGKSRREYIDLKLEEIDGKLYDIRERIKEYKTQNLAIDVTTEANKLVEQGVLMSSKLEITRAQLRETQSSVAELEKQLGLKPKAAINAVALGSGNKVLEQLRLELNRAVQEYEFDSEKLADTNPKMVAQKAKIDEINRQIKNQIESTIGKQTQNQNHMSIHDPVRESLVRNLVEKQTSYIGLQAEEQAVKRSIETINANQSRVPEKKFTLDNLEQEERALSKAYDNLKEKQIEARLKEAETASNIIIVDSPSLPEGPAFPSRLHMLAMALLLGVLAGIGVSALKTFVEDVCDDIESIEQITGTAGIGTIPWVDNFMPYGYVQSIHGMALDNIVSVLMMKCLKNNKKVLTFTSSSLEKHRMSMMYYMGTRLKKAGYSVVVVDSDFRIPAIIRELGLEEKMKINLSELITSLEDRLKETPSLNVKEEIESVMVTDERGINHLGNKDIVFEPYELFGSAAFEAIINNLKENFDWVLIDAGTIHITPEFSIISKLSDGIVLFADKNITRTTIKNISKIAKNTDSMFMGTIVREPDSKLEKEYEKYLRLQEDKLMQELVIGSGAK